MCEACEAIDAHISELERSIDKLQNEIIHARKACHIRELRDLEGDLKTIAGWAEEVKEMRPLSFENFRRAEMLLNKARYLSSKFRDMKIDMQILELQHKLQTKVSQDAWDIYLEIEALMNERLCYWSAPWENHEIF
ncbi:MAG TPA: hypothetical protein GXX51_10095 [Firmicutes bacterium]|nr:hypothetical protein [Bacillota bacterium]